MRISAGAVFLTVSLSTIRFSIAESEASGPAPSNPHTTSAIQVCHPENCCEWLRGLTDQCFSIRLGNRAVTEYAFQM
jgi:hypothetical protein